MSMQSWETLGMADAFAPSSHAQSWPLAPSVPLDSYSVGGQALTSASLSLSRSESLPLSTSLEWPRPSGAPQGRASLADDHASSWPLSSNLKADLADSTTSLSLSLSPSSLMAPSHTSPSSVQAPSPSLSYDLYDAPHPHAVYASSYHHGGPSHSHSHHGHGGQAVTPSNGSNGHFIGVVPPAVEGEEWPHTTSLGFGAPYDPYYSSPYPPSYAPSRSYPGSTSLLPSLSPRASLSVDDEERPWKCPIEGCGKTYRFKGDLKYHAQHKHMDIPDLPSTISRPRSDKIGKEFPCPWSTCVSGFKWERDLKRHIKVKHNCDPEYASYWAKFDNLAAESPQDQASPIESLAPFQPSSGIKAETAGFDRD